jgi:hypothetical protein
MFATKGDIITKNKFMTLDTLVAQPVTPQNNNTVSTKTPQKTFEHFIQSRQHPRCRHPPRGRERDGGLICGEMERDAYHCTQNFNVKK